VMFAGTGDFERYLETLAEFKNVHGVNFYAWCCFPMHAGWRSW
jgi:hypothetical protein